MTFKQQKHPHYRHTTKLRSIIYVKARGVKLHNRCLNNHNNNIHRKCFENQQHEQCSLNTDNNSNSSNSTSRQNDQKQRQNVEAVELFVNDISYEAMFIKFYCIFTSRSNDKTNMSLHLLLCRTFYISQPNIAYHYQFYYNIVSLDSLSLCLSVSQRSAFFGMGWLTDWLTLSKHRKTNKPTNDTYIHTTAIHKFILIYDKCLCSQCDGFKYQNTCKQSVLFNISWSMP